MTDDGAQTGPDAQVLVTVPEMEREIAVLGVAYPAFRFRLQGRPGSTRIRWVAERINGLTPGLHTVITADLRELYTALAGERGHAMIRRLKREMALRAWL